MKSLRYLTLMVILSACANEKLPKYTVVQGLRVLALQASVPELGFDGTSFSGNSVITPVISDVGGGGRALRYNLEWCLDLGISAGATPNCEGNPSRVLLKTNQSVTMVGGSFKAPNYTGIADDLAETIDFGGDPTALALIQQRFANAKSYELFNGLNLMVVFELFPTAEPTNKVTAIKRVVFSSSSKTSKNQNPSVLKVQLNGSEITDLPSIETALSAVFSGASQAESYTLMNLDGSLTSKTETLETTWFLTGPEDITCSKDKKCTTDGLFSRTRTRVGELNPFFPPQVTLPTTRDRVLIVVGRDDRGGMIVNRYKSGSLGP